MPADVAQAWNVAVLLRGRAAAEAGRLYEAADVVRRRVVGDAVHLRGLIEIGNHCVRSCAYCGLRRQNRSVERYRMTAAEIVDAAREARSCGCGTVVLQGGEDPGARGAWVAEVIRRIKGETGLAVTLSLGERSDGDLALWRESGADRYLLRFETSDRELYDRIHPSLPHVRSDRIALLRRLRELGYENGGGVMVGIPGQTCASVERDVRTFGDMDLDMIGIGPYIPHPQTPLGARPVREADDAVPNTPEAACVVLALARITCPEANLPDTTALALTGGGHASGLVRGANVIMLTITPRRYRALYQIYPGKSGGGDSFPDEVEDVRRLLASLGRTVATGPGPRVRRQKTGRP